MKELWIGGIFVFVLLFVTISLAVISFAAPQETSFQISAGESYSVGNYTISLLDLSPSTQQVIVSIYEGSHLVSPQEVLKLNKSVTANRLVLYFKGFVVQQGKLYAHFTALFTPVHNISSEDAKIIFLKMFPQYKNASITVASGPCVRSSSQCFYVSSFRNVSTPSGSLIVAGAKKAIPSYTFREAKILVVEKSGQIDAVFRSD